MSNQNAGDGSIKIQGNLSNSEIRIGGKDNQAVINVGGTIKGGTINISREAKADGAVFTRIGHVVSVNTIINGTQIKISRDAEKIDQMLRDALHSKMSSGFKAVTWCEFPLLLYFAQDRGFANLEDETMIFDPASDFNQVEDRKWQIMKFAKANLDDLWEWVRQQINNPTCTSINL